MTGPPLEAWRRGGENTRRAMRRASLAAGAAGLAASVTSHARAADTAPPAEPDWSKALGPGVGDRVYGRPSRFEADVIRRNVPWLTADAESSVSFTPLQYQQGIITPSGVFFERYHAFQEYFRNRFPDVPLGDFANGPYAMDAAMRRQCVEIMRFPPYDFALDEGKTAFGVTFANGKSYADCFANGGVGVRQNFPYFDTGTGEVVTLDLAINRCRIRPG